MGDVGGAPGFGQVDLEIEDEPSVPTSKKPPSHRNFGELDLDLGDATQGEEALPPSTSRVFGPAATRSYPVHEESTRITRPPPDTELAPSGSGVAPRDGRVAEMRELYANGDADGALALAAELGDSIASPDPFGGLIPMDDELAGTPTVKPPPAPGRTKTPPPPAVIISPPAAHLTLTERQSIPRLLKSMAEVSGLKIDHRAGFLLAHVDGMQTLEEILDICAMPSAEALALIASLKDMGVIEFE